MGKGPPGHSPNMVNGAATMPTAAVGTGAGAAGAMGGAPPTSSDLTPRQLYDSHFSFVWRNLRRLGVPDPIKGEALVCFCVLKPASAASEKLREELRARVAEQLGKPLKPEVLKFLDDLPKTRNAKIMRRIIRAAYLNQEPGDLSALENPHSVDAVRKAL